MVEKFALQKHTESSVSMFKCSSVKKSLISGQLHLAQAWIGQFLDRTLCDMVLNLPQVCREACGCISRDSFKPTSAAASLILTEGLCTAG